MRKKIQEIERLEKQEFEKMHREYALLQEQISKESAKIDKKKHLMLQNAFATEHFIGAYI